MKHKDYLGLLSVPLDHLSYVHVMGMLSWRYQLKENRHLIRECLCQPLLLFSLPETYSQLPSTPSSLALISSMPIVWADTTWPKLAPSRRQVPRTFGKGDQITCRAKLFDHTRKHESCVALTNLDILKILARHPQQIIDHLILHEHWYESRENSIFHV